MLGEHGWLESGDLSLERDQMHRRGEGYPRRGDSLLQFLHKIGDMGLRSINFTLPAISSAAPSYGSPCQIYQGKNHSLSIDQLRYSCILSTPSLCIAPAVNTSKDNPVSVVEIGVDIASRNGTLTNMRNGSSRIRFSAMMQVPSLAEKASRTTNNTQFRAVPGNSDWIVRLIVWGVWCRNGAAGSSLYGVSVRED